MPTRGISKTTFITHRWTLINTVQKMQEVVLMESAKCDIYQPWEPQEWGNCEEFITRITFEDHSVQERDAQTHTRIILTRIRNWYLLTQKSKKALQLYFYFDFEYNQENDIHLGGQALCLFISGNHHSAQHFEWSGHTVCVKPTVIRNGTKILTMHSIDLKCLDF